MLKSRKTSRNSPSNTRLFNKAFKMAESAAYRAKQKGLPCDSNRTIREECLRQMIQTNGRCPYLFKRYKIKYGKGADDYSPTLDRKVPAKGYVIGNIEVMSARANRIKSNANSIEVRAVADAMELRGL
jgi:hypothetical protein